MIFKYTEYTEHNGLRIDRPAVRLILKNGKYILIVRAVIDSGADYIILPLEVATQLNIKLGERTEFYSAGKNKLYVYKSPVEIEYILRKDGFRNISHKTIMYFAWKLRFFAKT